jgi:hypothetical protein
VLDLKNAALDKVMSATFPSTQGDVTFDQLDQPFPEGGGISFWSRGYNWEGVTACDDLVTVAPLSGSYFVHTHEPADVDLVITVAWASLHLVPYRMTVAPIGESEQDETLPYSRVSIRAECRARLRLPNEECLLLPHVDAGPIIFKDNQGRQLAEIPKLAEWWGFLGHFSDPPIENIETDPGGHGGQHVCCGMLRDLSTVVIPAWPAMKGTYRNSPNRLYAGRVGISFQECS